MGTWGIKIFQNDDACDIRDTYREKLIVGISDEDAEHAIIQEFSMTSHPENWIPLAVTQWKVGRMSEEVKLKALQQIEDELNCLSELWEPKQVPKRNQELLSTRDILCSKMPARKKLRMPWWAWKCPWSVGSVMQYKVIYPKENNPISQQYVMLLLVGISETPSDKIPCETISVALYDWHDSAPPNIQELSQNDVPLIQFLTRGGDKKPYHCIMPTESIMTEHELKCISTIPLSAMPQEPVTTFNPANSTFDDLISRTLTQK